MKYNAREIEKKWQSHWEDLGIYRTDLDSKKPKFYCLVMFPYPSGDKLHVGHWYNFGPADTYARYMRMKGYNVFEPMGFDAFGLPAENYAIKTGIHPTVSIKKNVEFMIQQLTRMGCMYDWEKMVNTSEPDYYKWTQWIFLQMYKHELAFRKTAPVNWCPSCQTVLANEQVQEGTCDRCDAEVTKKDLTQWFWKMSAYSQRLLDGHSGLNWPEKTVAMQQNWIGRSEGAELKFEIIPDAQHAIHKTGEYITVFTTRADTLFSAAFLVLAPEHPLVAKITTPKNRKNVEEYIEATRKKNDIQRTAEEQDKTGVFTGAYVRNPINGEKLQIWIADFVIISYGTGAVFADAHDTRDFAFAKKYKIPLKTTIRPADSSDDSKIRNLEECFTGYGILYDSGRFSGMTSEEARIEIPKELVKKKLGKLITTYRLRDWLISRQRYWGCPIPIVYCKKCGEVPVEEKDLPVLLPAEVDFKPRGDSKSPLASAPSFVKTKCPKCLGYAERETDTMDTFVDSSFYFLRYIDNKNVKKLAEAGRVKRWMPVDMYIGGPEHACMHLIYARFIMMALSDSGVFEEPKVGSRGSQPEATEGRGASPESAAADEWRASGGNYVSPRISEPFARLVHQGLITHKGAKMSKSKGNVVSPDEFVEKYGSDVFRMYLMFMGPFTDGGDWNDRGITGIARFADRVWHVMTSPHAEKDSDSVLYQLHKTVKKVTEDIEIFHFNTALSAMMELTNLAFKENMSLHSKKIFAQILAPFAPHLAEEVWEYLKEKFSIFDTQWPIFNPKFLQVAQFELVIQVNGKVRGRVTADLGISKEQAVALAESQPNVATWLSGKKRLKEIFVQDKLVNIVVGE